MSTSTQPQVELTELTEETLDAMEESNQLLKIFKQFVAKHMEADPVLAQNFPATIALQAFVLGATVALNGVGGTVNKIGEDVTGLNSLLNHLASTPVEGASDETE